ncbi:MAG: zf-HC2 domain-containing protein [Candidatus Krumholzibacteria bacterium]|nr:zf-HC2 domain-containing protein [Candidatus Krumholzibacteria bacterium]
MMKCRKAQDLYFLSRDGALDEAGRMELARHLAHCSSCGLLVKEMEASLDAIGSLPELSVSDGFEWNVKRRIMQEKSKLMRRDVEGSPFVEKRWVSRFALGAAAAAVVIVAATFVAQRIGMNEPTIREVSRENRAGTALVQMPSVEEDALPDYHMSGSYAGPRMVSDNIFTIERGGESVRQSPFEVVAGSREDSLTQENEMLKRRVQRLERQLMIYRGMLDKERMQRLNNSLP